MCCWDLQIKCNCREWIINLSAMQKKKRGSKRQALSGMNSPIVSLCPSISSLLRCKPFFHHQRISRAAPLQRIIQRHREIRLARQAGSTLHGGGGGGGQAAGLMGALGGSILLWLGSLASTRNVAGLTSTGGRGICKQSRKPASLDVPLC